MVPPSTACAMAFAVRVPVRITMGSAATTSAVAAAAAAEAKRTAATTAAASPGLRRFPWPYLHVGTDICHVGRIYAMLAAAPRKQMTAAVRPPSATVSSPRGATPAARLIRRVLAPQEVAALPEAEEEALLPSNASGPHVLAWLLAGGDAAAAAVAVGAVATPKAPSTPQQRKTALWTAAQYLAGRFAAKEATIKAHPHLAPLTFHRICVVRRPQQQADARNGSGPPVALIRVDNGGEDGAERKAAMEPETNADADADADADTGITEQEALLSISHDGDYATAVCLGFDHAFVLPRDQT
ncbi:histone deacetylase [Niveomyces insectorum RCEF 264]|uniref:Histone deacetylase n=1 Tax=Niveomyces insectorum RCEF 264 TaxID=1081102 RepID=A0A167PU72_9HYPO|nr:histone deacetylase [Niveomyces insectorum RCEF 264]